MVIKQWIEGPCVEKEYTHELWDSADKNGDMYGTEWLNKPEDELIKLFILLQNRGLLEEFEIATGYLIKEKKLRGNVLDAAAGVCWTSVLLSRFDQISRVDALDFSYFVLSKVATPLIKIMEKSKEWRNVDSGKINKIWGSFYDIKAKDKYDVIFMSQGFHHANDPVKLIAECDRVLAKDGVIVIIGEHIVDSIKLKYLNLKYFLKKILYQKKSIRQITKMDLFEQNGVYGDHTYKLGNYKSFFDRYNYNVIFVKSNIRKSSIVIATRR